MKMTRQQKRMIQRKVSKENAKKFKSQFTKLCQFPAPTWITKEIYENFLNTREVESKKFVIGINIPTLLGNFDSSTMTYNQAWGSANVRISPKFLYDKYLDETLISSPDSGQDSKTYSKEHLDTAGKHAARQWGWFDSNEDALGEDGSVRYDAPSQWIEYGTFNLVIMDGKLVAVPINCEHRLWGLIGFPLGCVPMPDNYQDLYYYHPDLEEEHDDELNVMVRRVKINGLYLSQIVELCHEKGAVNVTEETIKERFWLNQFNFTFLPFYNREKTEKFFAEVNDNHSKSLIQLFHAYPNNSIYWLKDFSSIKVCNFEPSGKSLHPLYESLSESKLYNLETMMISLLIGEYNVGGRGLIERNDKPLIESFKIHNEYSDDVRLSISNDMDFLYSLTSKYINVIDNKSLEITRPLAMNLLYMNDRFVQLGYCIADKALLINSWDEWFQNSQENSQGELTKFALAWRKSGGYKEAWKIIQENFLNDFDKETLRNIGVVKQPLHEPRVFSKDTITNSYKGNNGLDIDGNSFVYPVGGHIISDMELARMTEEEKNQAFSDEGLGDTFEFDKNCRSMSGYHNRRMGVLRLSEYMKVINDSDEIVKDKQRQKYEELKSKDILV
tara:strand:- start:1397 stop:3238 length:1842 start_codon:yes stop_codon:yes gene_type:complete